MHMSKKVEDEATLEIRSNTREIIINNRGLNKAFKYTSNHIKTSKYNIVNFIPKCLLIQFMRIANFYFLATAIVQSIKIISPYEPFTAIAPLGFVLLVSLIREGIDDIKRHRNDYLTNCQRTFLFNNNKYEAIEWRLLKVGDIVKVHNEEVFPADLMIISSSDEHGFCYVETSNLDGERNLKCKQIIDKVNTFVRSDDLDRLKGRILAEKPNNRIHNFYGLLYLNQSKEPLLVTNNQILLRGTTLKNTDWVLGVVIYSGHDTKTMKNQGFVRHKTTHIEKKLNRISAVILIIQSAICIVLAIFSSRFTEKYNKLFSKDFDASYIFYDHEWTPTLTGLLSYFSFFLLLNTMIPISLIISLEVMKFFQSLMIEADEGLLHKADGYGCKVLNTLIHEELGKIEYIFADKTGTLTSNNMEFKRCSIQKQEFTVDKLKEICRSKESLEAHLKFLIPELQPYFYDFWFALILCHDVIIDKSMYQGSSPDEVTLVQFAKEIGFEFIKKSSNLIHLKILNDSYSFQILEKIEFSSERKRMSIIVKDPRDDKIYLYTKGADSSIMNRLSNEIDQQEVVNTLKYALKSFSKDGLRTLCIAKKEVKIDFYLEWVNKYKVAKMEKDMIIKAVQSSSDTMSMTKLENEIEANLILLGATAVEDKLQEGVPETVKSLHEADAKIWMLTGDKLETAENIGYLCNLITKETKVMRVQAESSEDAGSRFEAIVKRIEEIRKFKRFNTDRVLDSEEDMKGNNNNNQELRNLESIQRRKLSELNIVGPGVASGGQSPKTTYYSIALVIEGDMITNILNNEELAAKFVKVIPECRSVICCRSTPNQKAEVVKFVKKHLDKTTLAIGDGGNDVNMIQAADIGVGILGKEGNQAAMQSDYSFSQFRFLGRILLLHGRWSYVRTAYFTNFFFYKNILFTFQQVWFAIYCGFSAQTFWEDGYSLNFNSIVTAAAPVYYGVWEQDVNPNQSEYIQRKLPLLYKEFRSKELFSYVSFTKFFLEGFFQSLGVFYTTKYSLDLNPLVKNGLMDGLWQHSVTAYSASIAVIVVTIVLDSSNWTVLTHFIYWFLTVIWYFPIFMYAWDQFTSPVQYNTSDIISTSYFWLIILLNLGIWGGLKYCVGTYRKLYYPSLIDKIKREAKIKRKLQNHKSNNSDEGRNILEEGGEANDLEPRNLKQQAGKLEPLNNVRSGTKEVKINSRDPKNVQYSNPNGEN